MCTCVCVCRGVAICGQSERNDAEVRRATRRCIVYYREGAVERGATETADLRAEGKKDSRSFGGRGKRAAVVTGRGGPHEFGLGVWRERDAEQ